MIKYPRTYHLPWSEGRTSDDKTLANCDHFAGKVVVVTEKRDGENTTLYRDGMHARSIDGRHHPSRNWVKGLQGAIGYTIPEGWRVCGENLYARHSFAYSGLPSYFEAFSVWTDENACLSWEETLEFCRERGIHVVPTLWTGVWEEAKVRSLIEELDTEAQEGIVVRVAEGFRYDEFGSSVAKWVRANHVQTEDHWMHSAVVANELV